MSRHDAQGALPQHALLRLGPMLPDVLCSLKDNFESVVISPRDTEPLTSKLMTFIGCHVLTPARSLLLKTSEPSASISCVPRGDPPSADIAVIARSMAQV